MSFPKNAVDNQVYSKNGNFFRYNASTNSWIEGKSIELYSDFDITTTAPVTGDTLLWNGSKIVPETVKVKPDLAATVDDLPLINNSIGDVALVSDTHRVYMWDSYGWQEIATANNYPIIGSFTSSHTYLELNTAPVTLTLEAADPEGMPISWSYSIISGSLGGNTVSFAGNVATITPSTDPADVNNSFVIKFTVTDGILAESTQTGFTVIVLGPNAWDISYITRTANNSLLVNGTTLYSGINTFTIDSITGATAINHFYKPDGTRFYFLSVSATTAYIKVVDLSTPYDFDTVTAVTNYTHTSTLGTTNQIGFSPDGTKYYASNSDGLKQFDTSLAPWDPFMLNQAPTTTIATATGVSTFTWSDDGYTIIVCIDLTTSKNFEVYTLSTAWDLTTASLSATYSSILNRWPTISGRQASGSDHVRFSPDGSKYYLRVNSILPSTTAFPQNAIITIPMTTPWDLTTLDLHSATYLDLNQLVYSTYPANRQEFNFADNGTKLLIVSVTNAIHRIDQFDLLEAWNPASLDWSEIRYISSTAHEFADCIFDVSASSQFGRFTISPDGTKLYADSVGEAICAYNIRHPWKLHTMEIMDAFTFEKGANGAAEGLTIAGDSSRLYRLDIGESITQIMLDEDGYPIDHYPDTNVNTTLPSGAIIFGEEYKDQWFSSDGLTYIVLHTNLIVRYILDTPYDITTAKGNYNKFYNLPENTGTVTAYHISPDGHHVHRRCTDDVIQHYYTKEAWNFYKLRYVGAVAHTAGVDQSGIHWDPTGTYMYIMDYTGNVYQSKASTPWHVSELIVVDTINVGNITASDTRQVRLSPDGTKMYILRYTGYIEEYVLSVPYMVSSATFSYQVDIEVAGDQIATGYGEANALDLQITNDGTTVLTFGLQTDKLQQWSMTTPWDLSTLTWVGMADEVSYGLDGSTTVVASYGLHISPDKTKMWVGLSNNGLAEITLQSAGDFFNYKRDFIYLSELGIGNLDVRGFEVFDNESILYISYSDDIYKVELTDPTDYSTATVTNSWLSVGSVNNDSMRISPDGTRVICGANSSIIDVRYYELSTPFDFSSGTMYNITNDEPLVNGFENGSTMTWNSDGTELWVIEDIGAPRVRVLKLDIPYDPRSWYDNSQTSLVVSGSYYHGLRLTSDESKVFYNVMTTGPIYNKFWLEMSTPGDLSTAYDGLTAFNNRNTLELVPLLPATDVIQAIAVKPDGTKFYLLGTTLDQVHEFTMSTRYDITTASYTTTSEKLTTVHGLPNVTWENLKFKPDGTKMYVMAANIIYELNLSTPWDLATISYASKTYTITPTGTITHDIVFTPDGNNVIYLDVAGAYTLTTLPII